MTVDINGDFKSDILYVTETGRVTTWINQRGGDKSLKPYWRSAGVTHAGVGEDVNGQVDSILFGRLYSDFHTDVYFLKPHFADQKANRCLVRPLGFAINILSKECVS